MNLPSHYSLQVVQLKEIEDMVHESAPEFMDSINSKEDIYQLLLQFSQQPNFYLLVLKNNLNEIAGYISNINYKNLTDTAAIGPMYISKRYRGLGLGKLQVELFMKYIKLKGFKKVITKTWSSNKGSRRIFEELGFNIDKITENDRANGDSTIKYIKDL